MFFKEDSEPKWFLALGERWVGPLTASDIYEKIRKNEATWAHYIWRTGLSEWKRICDVKVFQAVVPPEPSRQLQAKVKAQAQEETSKVFKPVFPPPIAQNRAMVKDRIWFLHHQDSQFGPFSAEEVVRFLQVGKIPPDVHAWRDGMDGWEALGKTPEFSQAILELKRVTRKSSQSGSVLSNNEKRRNNRRPLVARIFLNHEEAVIVAVCRDISVGGMQVLTDRIPGGPGTRLKMNVSPAGDLKNIKLQPFLAEGIVVRVLEDSCGFSFRFENLPDRARRAIEGYIDSSNG